MIEVNLIPDVKQELLRAQRARRLVISGAIIVSIVALAVVTLLAIWVFAVQTVRSTVADSDIKKGYAQLQSHQDLSKVLTIQNQLTQISTLNNSKHDDSRIFDVLAAISPASPNNISASDVGVDSNAGAITIQAQATNGYQALEVFKKMVAGATITFTVNGSSQTEPLASDISTTDVSYGQDASGATVLHFTLSFTYPEDLFSPLSSGLTVVPVSQGNATDSYLGLPQTGVSN